MEYIVVSDNRTSVKSVTSQYTSYGGVHSKISSPGDSPIPSPPEDIVINYPTSTTHGSTTHGSATHGSTTHGSATNGSTTHGSTTHGSATHGSATHGSATHGRATHGSTTHGSTTHGASTHILFIPTDTQDQDTYHGCQPMF